MSQLSDFTDGVFLIDFEFRPENGREGNTPEPVCLVVKDFLSGVTSRYWKSQAIPPHAWLTCLLSSD